MRSDTPPAEVARRTRKLAAHIEEALPAELPEQDHPDWGWVAPLLLRRIATQLRTLAVLLDARVGLDALMLVRSLLEHATLFAWLATTPDDGGVDSLAVDPEANTRWWIAEQYHQEIEDRRKQELFVGPILDTKEEQARYDAGRSLAAKFKRQYRQHAFPKTQELAAEADRFWGPRLEGWREPQPAPARHNALTLEGWYWTLYKIGNGSAHPRMSALTGAFAPAPDDDDAASRPLRDQNVDLRDAMYAMAPYIAGYAVQIAHEVLGWPDHDRALKILGRYHVVRGGWRDDL